MEHDAFTTQNKHLILKNWNDEKISMDEIIENIFNLLNLSDVGIKNEVTKILKNHKDPDPSDRWFHALKIISISSVKNDKIFSQSQIYDLLTILSRILDRNKKEVVNPITFTVYKDVMENYQGLEGTLKLIFPVIVVNLMHIIRYGKDIEGNSVNLFAINNYYQNSKVNLKDNLEKILAFRIENNLNESDLVIETLEKLTGRNETDIQNSLQNIHETDLKKVCDLCNNYQKLTEYGKLIESDEFSKIIEKEIGKKLSESQLQHAANSIKKTKLYLEKTLDGGFLPKGKHGINHVKHNIEYGFQLMGIMQSKRRKTGTKK